MTGGRPVFPFNLRAIRFEEDGKEWVVFSYVTDSEGTFPPTLSAAQRDVLARVLAGHSNAAIARARSTSPRTVANQVAELLRRFQLSSRRDLIARFETGESITAGNEESPHHRRLGQDHRGRHRTAVRRKR